MQQPVKKPVKKVQRGLDQRYIVGGLIVLLALAAAIIPIMRPAPPPSPEQVFAQGVVSKNFLQVSLYSIAGVYAGQLQGNGHVRYSKDGQIFGYGDSVTGSPLKLNFSNQSDLNYKSCMELVLKPAPFKKELFIAGSGVTGTNGLPNPATGKVGSANDINFTGISACMYTDKLN